VFPEEWKELLGGEKGTPRERESRPRRYVPKGRVKLWLRMCCVPKEKVPRDWMQHRGERKMGVP